MVLTFDDNRLPMSAENILGLLLEEFLAEQLADYGWFCGWGEVIRHVDRLLIRSLAIALGDRRWTADTDRVDAALK
jgi:hypothetical protein